MLITCTDNLNGFTDTIRTVFPQFSTRYMLYIRLEIHVNTLHIKIKKSLFQTWRIYIMLLIKKLLKQKLIICKENGQGNIHMLLFHVEWIGMIWLSFFSFHCISEKLYIRQILLKILMEKSENIQKQNFHFHRMKFQENCFSCIDGDWKRKWMMPISNWGLIMNQFFDYIWKQNPDIKIL